jgi:hypothetical protein
VEDVKNEAFVRDFPQNLKVEDVKNEAFARDIPQILKVQVVRSKPESLPLQG